MSKRFRYNGQVYVLATGPGFRRTVYLESSHRVVIKRDEEGRILFASNGFEYQNFHNHSQEELKDNGNFYRMLFGWTGYSHIECLVDVKLEDILNVAKQYATRR